MVDDSDEVRGGAQQAPDDAGEQEPVRRRRRAASRPAGPPETAAHDDQGELSATAGGEPGEHGGADAGSATTDAPPQEAGATDEAVAAALPDAVTGDAQQGEADLPPIESEVHTVAHRRPRRATRGVTTVAFSAVPAEEPPAAMGAGAGPEPPAAALFQPPDETRAVRTPRRSRSAASEAPGPDGGDGGESAQPAGPDQRGRSSADDDEAPGSQAGAGDASAATDVADSEGADTDDRSDDDAPRRRRRRGGRRRRRSGGSGGEEGEEQDGADEDSASDESGGDEADGPGEGDSSARDEESDEAAQPSSARRRRRRRRRAGVSEEMEDLSSEDPPNTVVKVREARQAKDEITSVRGSTRIEAKKQRRRDGREAGRRRAPILSEAEFLARREAVKRVMCVREHGDRTQIAVLEDDILVEHYVNRAESSSLVGNVYLGKVQNVLPSMEAAFVDIGRGRNAVLYAGEVNWDAAGLEGQPKRIELAMKSGDPVLVQVTKDPVGHKGARLTSQISLPGRFLVYVPEGSMTGISRKLPDTERSRLKQILKEVVPAGAGIIVRTAAEGAAEDQLTADVARLAAQWEDIAKKAKSASAPALLYREPDLAIKVVRDMFNEDFESLVVQGDSTYATLHDYIGWVAPDLLPKMSQWVEPGDLYAAHRIDEQVTKALDRKVWLPSGGSLVIDRTEAMTVVDVNTGKFTGQGGNLEETVTKNNLEAAEEIVRQLRLRDIGGIVVVDFIDMVLESNRDLVLRRLVECLGRDRTKHQVAEVTSLGLVQMTRKRIGQGLLEVFSTPCEHCNGRGHIVSSEPVGGDRMVEEPASSRRGGRRGTKKKAAPAALGGKQTGKTPPPPRFDDEGQPPPGEHPQPEPAAGPQAEVPPAIAEAGTEATEAEIGPDVTPEPGAGPAPAHGSGDDVPAGDEGATSAESAPEAADVPPQPGAPSVETPGRPGPQHPDDGDGPDSDGQLEQQLVQAGAGDELQQDAV